MKESLFNLALLKKGVLLYIVVASRDQQGEKLREREREGERESRARVWKESAEELNKNACLLASSFYVRIYPCTVIQSCRVSRSESGFVRCSTTIRKENLSPSLPCIPTTCTYTVLSVVVVEVYFYQTSLLVSSLSILPRLSRSVRSSQENGLRRIKEKGMKIED